MVKVLTCNPIAVDSNDHLHPHGTKNDNSTSIEFVTELVDFFKKRDRYKFNFMDLGCAGGKLVSDFIQHCRYSVGLEGSDYSLKRNRAEWAALANKNLFTCDVSKHYVVYDDDNKPIKPIRFDLITAWEVIEHIELRDMDTFFYNIWQHLNQVGIFCGTISLVGDLVDGVQLHSTIMSEQNWYRYFERLALFEMHNSLIKNRVRQETTSIFIVLQKIDKISTEHLYLVEPDLYKHFRSV